MIVLITPTGARGDQFGLCRRWMNQQTYDGEVLWIIIDDCLPRTTDIVKQDFRNNWLIHKVYPVPIWQTGMNTQGRNMIAGLTALKNNYNLNDISAIFVIEDDDYYKPIYLDEMMRQFKTFDAIGETRTIYYNVVYRRYMINANTSHASLFQTAFTPRAIDYMINSHKEQFIDVRFWKTVMNRRLFFAGNLSVGIKGMPGRRGIGAGHGQAMRMNDDAQLAWLKNIIGEDAQYYARFYKTNNYKHKDILTNKDSYGHKRHHRNHNIT